MISEEIGLEDGFPEFVTSGLRRDSCLSIDTVAVRPDATRRSEAAGPRKLRAEFRHHAVDF